MPESRELITRDGHTKIVAHEWVTGAALRQACVTASLHSLRDNGSIYSIAFDRAGHAWKGAELAIEVVTSHTEIQPRHERLLDAASRLSLEADALEYVSVAVARGAVRLSVERVK